MESTVDKWKVLLSVIVIICIGGNVYFWHYTYGNMFQNRYHLGYVQGYQSGNVTGHDLGYSLGYSSGSEEGYDGGYLQGVEDGVGRGYTVRDPTYQEALQFIAVDQSEKHVYSEEYICVNFAADFNNNAFQAGYRCGFVFIYFPEIAHSIVCFNTTDHGVLFIEPQSDEIVDVILGQPYWDGSQYVPPNYDDTVFRIVIVW
jgi:hypothetical protein